MILSANAEKEFSKFDLPFTSISFYSGTNEIEITEVSEPFEDTYF